MKSAKKQRETTVYRLGQDIVDSQYHETVPVYVKLSAGDKQRGNSEPNSGG